MGEASKEVQLRIITQNQEHARSSSSTSTNTQDLLNQFQNSKCRPYKWWLKVAVYSFCVLSGQTAATLLGRQYYDKGGSSKWLASLVQLCGFPILISYYFLFSSSTSSEHARPNYAPAEVALADNESPPLGPSLWTLACFYILLGTLVAADCYLYSVGLQYLPVSTYSLICASQLAFNAMFSFFLNSQKFTPFIVNSLVLLTISSILLVFQTGSEKPAGVSKLKNVIGFICTLGAAAGYALTLSLTQLFFKKVIKKETFKAVIDLIIFKCLVATCIIVVGLFASGEWEHLTAEMERYKLGKISYIMNLTWTAVSWKIFAIGSNGLICDASSLFSNSISVVGLPIVPVLAVFFFHDKMSGVKAIAMVLAVWGFASYVYQHYLDDSKSKRSAGHAERWYIS
ncbi:probable purine permease 10 isoform X1 [Punica granatum]|uniref:Probable purine permease n=2 Tax=Punica granatum TaxID=22663 RepID=A0A2I0L8C0_PUNGR|nr:probable purine permease 10 isoform X1 [Punica granatum]PKI76941.1 hypothetical protein CRG98_002728 [Punica granatum]